MVAETYPSTKKMIDDIRWYTHEGLRSALIPPRARVYRRWLDRIRREASGRIDVRKRVARLWSAVQRYEQREVEREDCLYARIGYGLALCARQYFDDARSRDGVRDTTVIQAVPAWQSSRAPYHDHGRAGMALVGVTRRRYYGGRFRGRVSSATDYYIVGRNECGTYYAHPVSGAAVRSGHCIEAVLSWMWSGHSRDIIQRQGDVALIRGRGPKMPERLPAGHHIEGGQIVHDSHAPLPLPGPGQRIIVARRANVRVSAPTRD